MNKKALISGITGQDGSYLAELLLEKGYCVYGIGRHTGEGKLGNAAHLKDSVRFIQADMTELEQMVQIMKRVQPDEVYNLAAQSFMGTSWEQPVLTCEINGLGVLKILEAIRREKPDARFFQASSGEMFGHIQEMPQCETTPFFPRSHYATAKLFGHWMTRNYRENYGTYACSGILFNHESPRRGPHFVTRKVSMAVARIKKGMQDKVSLGNLDSKRDWGFSGDYVRAMWLMLQQEAPDDFVIATGETHTIREMCDVAFRCVGLDYRDYVEIDPRFFRADEINTFLGSPRKAAERLGWKPSVAFDELISMMVRADLELLEKNGG